MRVPIEITEGVTLYFRLPVKTEVDAAWDLKDAVGPDMNERQVMASVLAQLSPLLVASKEDGIEREPTEAVRESALLYGRTGLGRWTELYFRDYRSSVGND